jgi:hypothetical protein
MLKTSASETAMSGNPHVRHGLYVAVFFALCIPRAVYVRVVFRLSVK